MNLLRLGFFFLPLGCMAAGQEHPSHLRGTWSNEQNEFKTLAISLRSDGQAVVYSAVISAFARWSAKENILTLTIGTEGKSQEWQLTYDPGSRNLTITRDKSTQELRKISDEEPPDWLAKSREKAAQQQAEQNQAIETMMIREETACANLEEAIKVLYSIIHASPEERTLETVFPRHSQKKIFLSMRGRNESLFVDVNYETRSLSKPSGYLLTGTHNREDDADLPVTYALDPEIQKRVLSFAETSGIECGKHVWLQYSPFSPEKSSRRYSLRLSAVRTGNSSQLEDFLRAVWPDPGQALTVAASYRRNKSANRMPRVGRSGQAADVDVTVAEHRVVGRNRRTEDSSEQ